MRGTELLQSELDTLTRDSANMVHPADTPLLSFGMGKVMLKLFEPLALLHSNGKQTRNGMFTPVVQSQ